MKLIVNDKTYNYYDDSYLLGELKDYINENKEINVNSLPYEKVNRLYDSLCAFSTMLIAEPFPTEELEEKNTKINSQINKTNHMRDFLKNKGKELESKELMIKFINTILAFDEEYSKFGDTYVEEDNYGILR